MTGVRTVKIRLEFLFFLNCQFHSNFNYQLRHSDPYRFFYKNAKFNLIYNRTVIYKT